MYLSYTVLLLFLRRIQESGPSPTRTRKMAKSRIAASSNPALMMIGAYPETRFEKSCSPTLRSPLPGLLLMRDKVFQTPDHLTTIISRCKWQTMPINITRVVTLPIKLHLSQLPHIAGLSSIDRPIHRLHQIRLSRCKRTLPQTQPIGWEEDFSRNVAGQVLLGDRPSLLYRVSAMFRIPVRS